MVNFTKIINFMHHANTQLQKPKVRMLLPVRRELNLTLAAAHSRNPGAVYMKGPDYGDYYGKIMPQAPHTISWSTMVNAADKKDIVALLVDFMEDPTKVAKIYACETGNCCFCGLALTDPRSIAVGYGPICAEKYGLPWGEVQLSAEADEVMEQLAQQLQPLKNMPASHPCYWCNAPTNWAGEGDWHWIECTNVDCRAAGPRNLEPSIAKQRWNSLEYKKD